jgi:exodeoxyribonuclease VII small subunit
MGELIVTRKNKPIDLETSLAEINTLIEQMEQGEQTLEQSLSRFERVIHLIKHCQKTIQEAEQKVNILLQKNGSETLQPYENTEE